MGLTEVHWTAQAGYPILAMLQGLPIAAVALTLLAQRPRVLYAIGVTGALLEVGLALDLYRRFDPRNPAFQLVERLDLAPPLVYHTGVDGMSVLLVVLSALLTLLVILYGVARGRGSSQGFLASVFAIEASLMGMLATLDLLWFTAFSGVQLTLVGYVLWRWATSPGRGLMLTRYLQFMAVGLALLVAGTVMLGWGHADATDGRWSFALADLSAVHLPASLQSVAFFLLFYGLAIRIPLFPLHGWLPLTAEHGNIARGPVFLLGVKTGVFGLLRFVFPTVPDAVAQWHPYVVGFALTGIFYAALLALMQDNLRRLLAYAVVSHTSVLVIGLFSLTHAAFQGAVILSVNFGLAIAALLFMTGFIQRRTRTTLLPKLGGLFDPLPVVGVAFLIASLSILEMPGTPGFDAAHLMLEEAVGRFGALLTMAAALGNVAAAGFLLRAFQRTFLAPRASAEPAPPFERATPVERLVALIIVSVLLGTGFYSEPLLRLTDRSLVGVATVLEQTLARDRGSP
jgi:NADH-quinone oxidoreductase subunit M